jgi:hypothetical protein
MTERAYITVNRAESPRIVQVAAVGNGGSDGLKIQDLHDTLNSNTLPAGDPDDSLDNMDDAYLIESVGKAVLGDSLATGITSELQNAQLAFEGNYTPTATGTIDSVFAGVISDIVIDAGAQFVTDGIKRGDIVFHWADHSVTEVLEVTNETTLKLRKLQGGITNAWSPPDSYSIFAVIQKVVSDGNLVSVDENGDPINAIFPTFCTQVVVTLDTSAAQVATAGLTPSQQQIRDALTLSRTQAAQANSVDELLDNNPANVVAALGAAEYDGVSYEEVITFLLAMAKGRIRETSPGSKVFEILNQADDTVLYKFEKTATERVPVAV